MINDLIVLTFSQAEHAYKAWQALIVMRSSGTFVPESGRLVKRDRYGKAVVQQHKILSYPQSETQSKVLELFIDVIFGNAIEEQFSRLADSGLDEVFLRDVAKALQPESSALLFYIPHDFLVDTRHLLSSLALLRGTLYHTSFPDEVEASILALAR